MNEDFIKKEIERLSPWYSTIELSPGVFTKGYMLRNIALTRELIRRCDIKGTKCLDIGTMEAVVPILLKRQGSSEVIGIDGDNRSNKMPLLKSVYGVDFQYYGHIALDNMLEFLLRKSKMEAVGGKKENFGFDLVVLSGVLYHVFSPAHVLAAARSCLKEGGFMIIETAVIKEQGYYMQFNYTGDDYIYDWTDYWFFSVPLLDYLCRFFKLAPLDCVYLAPGNYKFPRVIRLGVICKATDSVLQREKENIMYKSSLYYDYNFIVQYDLCSEKREFPIPYEFENKKIIRYKDTNTCNLFETINNMSPLELTDDKIVLKLNDTY